MLPIYSHPYSYDLGETHFFTTPENLKKIEILDKELDDQSWNEQKSIKLLNGEINWSKNAGCQVAKKVESVSKEVIFIALDDAIGQGNKLLKAFGVTAFLEVKYSSNEVPLESQSKIVVHVTNREESRKSRAMKTFCKAEMLSETGKVQATATALFIDNQELHKNKLIQIDQSDSKSIELKRLKPFGNLKKENYHSMITLENQVVTWNDGQGPKNHVHGGVMSIPIFHFLKEQQINSIHINFKCAIPLGTKTKLKLVQQDEKIEFNMIGEKLHFNGYAQIK